jgi:hypothetical protein
MEEIKNTGKKKKKKKIRKVLRWILLVVILVVLWDIAPTFFYGPESNDNPLQPFYKKGVYHMHSVFSDGKGTVDDITKAARELGLDFAVLTDHGRPNVPSSDATAWMNDVLLIGAGELSLNCGHLAAMGYETPKYIFPPEPQEAIDEIVKDNPGICFISHPYDTRINWKDWDIEGFTGLEVLSSYTEARRAGVLKILIFPLKYSINSKYALLDTMNYPKANMKKWAELNEQANMRSRFYGIYALDAHAKLPITKKISLGFPTYKAMFEIMTVYVRTGGPLDKDADKAEKNIVEAMKLGRFFNVLEAIAPANGFDGFFLEEAGGKRVEMGGVTEAKKGKIVLLTPFEFETDIRLFKNGTVAKQITNNTKKRVELDVSEAGVYRVEVFVPGNTFDDLPWIMTNPFFVSPSPPPIDDRYLKRMAITAKKALPDAAGGEVFKLEKNEGSEGMMAYEEGVLKFTFRLERDSPTSRDFWSVMALRKEIDLSAYRGLVLNVKSSKRLRYWLEFRTGKSQGQEETWRRHSFLAEPGWKKIVIPFSRFHPYLGKKQKADMSAVQSLFLGINNQSAYEGTAGVLEIEGFGVY